MVASSTIHGHSGYHANYHLFTQEMLKTLDQELDIIN